MAIDSSTYKRFVEHLSTGMIFATNKEWLLIKNKTKQNRNKTENKYPEEISQTKKHIQCNSILNEI